MRLQYLLGKGISSISSVIQEVLDVDDLICGRSIYCFRSCFVVLEGFSMPKVAVKEATKLQSELQLLEKQSALSDKHAEYVNEAVQLFEENSLPDMFQVRDAEDRSRVA
ncbi:hypothetical protein Scep_022304 [Stephania cephalantha]|uniref:Uncharacterized protein n=1 Tax=Stephania cephalantha TaxID=152367 RepID=A0AAP0F546_9MAGN